MTRLATLVVLGLLLAAQLRTDDSGPVQVRLREKAILTGPQVLVRDVAEIDGGHPYLREQIARLDLLQLPLSGRCAPINRLQVAIRLELAGLDARGFEITGAPSVSLELLHPFTLEELVVVAARQELTGQLAGESAAYSIQLMQPTPPVPALLGHPDDIFVEPQLTSPPTVPGTVRVEVAPRVKSVRHPPIVLVFQVEPARKVELAHAEGAPPGAPVQQAAAHTQTTVPVPRTVPTAPAVHARDPVQLVIRIGDAQITAQGEAQQNGDIGQLIRVRNTDSNKIILGRVVSSSVVAVSY